MRIVVELKRKEVVKNTLILLAPDEGKDQAENAAWQIIIKGSSDPVMATKGIAFASHREDTWLLSQVRTLLFDHVSSSLVGEYEEEVARKVEELRAAYHAMPD